VTPRRILLIAIAAGLAIRLGFALGYWVGKPLTHDEIEYLVLARNLAEGRGFTYETGDPRLDAEERFGRVPGYSAFIVLVTAGQVPIDRIPVSLKIAQCVVGALGIWVVAAFAGRAAGERAGAAAAAIAAVYPPLVWICAYALSEAVYSVIALTSALLLWMAVDGRRVRGSSDERPAPAFGSGIAAGAATLTRPATLLFVVLALPWLVGKRRFAAAAAMLAGAVIVIAPWTARNIREYGRFVLVSSQGGVTFWTGNNPLSTGEGDMAANPAIKRRNQELRARYPQLTPEELEPIYRNEAWTFIREHPAAWAWLMLRKLFYTFVPIGRSYTLHSTLYYATSVVAYGVLVPFAIAGLLELRKPGAQPWPLWLLAASAVLTCLVFFPQERFRLPVIDPTLVVAAGTWSGWRRLVPAGGAAER
jgi:hypothetical protein